EIIARPQADPASGYPAAAVPRPEPIRPAVPRLEPDKPKIMEGQARKPDVLKRPPPVLPSRSWTEVLAAFMEQRNIRWGELIGGLLFVCSSIALVVSLWETLERIPYSKFFIFVSISSAVFGV